MISENELEERLERARGNPKEDQEFFRYLLEATVYAHAPISDDSEKFRLIQFKHLMASTLCRSSHLSPRRQSPQAAQRGSSPARGANCSK